MVIHETSVLASSFLTDREWLKSSFCTCITFNLLATTAQNAVWLWSVHILISNLVKLNFI
jgi:hypothetical protein